MRNRGQKTLLTTMDSLELTLHIVKLNMESYYASVNSESDSCKRPYALGKRLEQSDGRKAKIMAAARAQLESGGLPAFTLEAVAQIGGFSRQTVHNLFKTKS